MATPFDDTALFRDALIGLSCVFGWYLASLVTARRVGIGPAVGMVVLTAACAVVAYHHGKRFGETELP